MQNPQLTLKIELLGGLVEELAFWSNDLKGDEYSDNKFEEVLDAVREMREVVLEELEDYFNECKLSGEPIALNYYRVKKELERTTFQEKR